MAAQGSKRIQNLAYAIDVGTHQLVADVPQKLGGEDKGPNPHEYLEVSLAACTAITLQMYANRKGIPLESSDVMVQITQEGADNQILRNIKLVGNLTEEQRQALFKIAEKCPIHSFLMRGAKIASHLL